MGVKNGTLDKLTKEMPTLATSQTETEKSAENESEKMILQLCWGYEGKKRYSKYRTGV